MQGSMSEADCSVGTIVWVRRRNGSWWPGRILGPNELSASLMSPRSGTPVKLLGREDASVDWYNLEKSKRVKAFRCGEFDDCIERAETFQGNPIKKREKYARREDAILHALELERQQLERKRPKLGVAVNSASTKMPSVVKKELGTVDNLANGHSKSVNLKSQPSSKRIDSSLEDKSMRNRLYALKAKHGKHPIREGDNFEAGPRMRGLLDFGLRIAPTKKNRSDSVTLECSRRPLPVENHVDALPSGVRSMGSEDHVSTSKKLLDMKRKRTEVGPAEESLVKRRDRRRPLVQVLQSSAKILKSQSLQSDGDGVSISIEGEKDQTGDLCRSKRNGCVDLPDELNDCLEHAEFPVDKMQELKSQFGTDSCHVDPSSTEENSSSGLMEEESSDFSEREYLDQDMSEERAMVSNATRMPTVAGPRNSGRHLSGSNQVQVKAGSMSDEELDESAFTGYGSQLHSYDQTAVEAADVGASKWQLKGKRNIRNLPKRSMDLIDQDNSNGTIHGTYFERRRNNLNRRVFRQGFYHRSKDLGNDFDEDDLIEKDLMQSRMWGFGNRRYPSKFKAARRDHGRQSANIFNSEGTWEADGPSQVALRGHWDESGECFDPIYGGHCLNDSMESWLVEVDLKVQASYQGGEHVPLVSLMSRLNGKAIVGHPVQIEALEDGSSDLFFTNEDFREEPTADNGGSTTPVPPVWRTARRTVMHRVPRTHPSSSAALEDDEAEAADQNHHHRRSDLESKPPRPPYKKSFEGHLSSHKAKLLRKIISNNRTEKKNPNKLLRKVTLSSQKTRMLSSIAIEQKRSGKSSSEKLASKSSSVVDGLIKLEEAGPTIVTCIPVKLVFSRLMEAVGRPPSSRLERESHGVLINGGDTEKKSP
ncbi:PWWP domain [Macleaya cordata]|uniref:PWWP domain n=1 Tax=Macleaya cordata TaxID=56857 RepID=A0A200QNR8_MACCD|nr:PWWP domain [Macleaya cordata]